MNFFFLNFFLNILLVTYYFSLVTRCFSLVTLQFLLIIMYYVLFVTRYSLTFTLYLLLFSYHFLLLISYSLKSKGRVSSVYFQQKHSLDTKSTKCGYYLYGKKSNLHRIDQKYIYRDVF